MVFNLSTLFSSFKWVSIIIEPPTLKIKVTYVCCISYYCLNNYNLQIRKPRLKYLVHDSTLSVWESTVTTQANIVNTIFPPLASSKSCPWFLFSLPLLLSLRPSSFRGLLQKHVNTCHSFLMHFIFFKDEFCKIQF